MSAMSLSTADELKEKYIQRVQNETTTRLKNTLKIIHNFRDE